MCRDRFVQWKEGRKSKEGRWEWVGEKMKLTLTIQQLRRSSKKWVLSGQDWYSKGMVGGRGDDKEEETGEREGRGIEWVEGRGNGMGGGETEWVEGGLFIGGRVNIILLTLVSQILSRGWARRGFPQPPFPLLQSPLPPFSLSLPLYLSLVSVVVSDSLLLLRQLLPTSLAGNTHFWHDHSHKPRKPILQNFNHWNGTKRSGFEKRESIEHYQQQTWYMWYWLVCQFRIFVTCRFGGFSFDWSWMVVHTFVNPAHPSMIGTSSQLIETSYICIYV